MHLPHPHMKLNNICCTYHEFVQVPLSFSASMEQQPPAHYEGWTAHAQETKICWNLFGLANHGDYVVNLYA